MLNLEVENPTELFLELGRRFCSENKEDGPLIDFRVGGRSFSLTNTLTIKNWDSKWTGMGLFHMVGYARNGYKMKKVRGSYIDEIKFYQFKNELQILDKKMSYFSIGMPLKMKMRGKGGCLSSIHIVKRLKTWKVYVHAKVMEVPRKFMGDLILIRDLLKELKILDRPTSVVLMLSTMYFSIVSLRAYKELLNLKRERYRGLILERDTRKFQRGSVTRINEFRKSNLTTLSRLNLTTGEWK